MATNDFPSVTDTAQALANRPTAPLPAIAGYPLPAPTTPYLVRLRVARPRNFLGGSASMAWRLVNFGTRFRCSLPKAS